MKNQLHLKHSNFNPFISNSDEHPMNIDEKLVAFETSQFINPFISFNDEQ